MVLRSNDLTKIACSLVIFISFLPPVSLAEGEGTPLTKSPSSSASSQELKLQRKDANHFQYERIKITSKLEIRDDELEPYMRAVLPKIRRQAMATAGNLDKIAVVGFEVAKDGTASNVHLVKASGVADIDGFAQECIKYVAKFPPLPASAGESLEMEWSYGPFPPPGSQYPGNGLLRRARKAK
jgi:hypothetical protein